MKSKKESVSRDQIWKSAILVWSGHFHIFWLISIGPSETGSISGDFVQIFYIGFGRSITVKFDDGRSPKWPRESALHVFIFLFSQLKRWHLVSMPLIRSPTKKNKHINIHINIFEKKDIWKSIGRQIFWCETTVLRIFPGVLQIWSSFVWWLPNGNHI